MAEIPYIGVTGPTSIEQVQHLSQGFKEAGIDILHTDHQPMIGILVSLQTLQGLPMRNRRYPSFETIPSLLEGTDNTTFNTLHYYSPDTKNLTNQITRAFSQGVYENNLSRGIQINIPWPPLEEIKNVIKQLPELKIIMQLSRASLQGKTPQEVARLVKGYGDTVSQVLFDLSGGEGKTFDAHELFPFYSELHEVLPDLAIGFAGGFTGENVKSRVQELIRIAQTHTFSIDAEGGLRDKITDRYGDDLYNRRKVEDYIKQATAGFNG